MTGLVSAALFVLSVTSTLLLPAPPGSSAPVPPRRDHQIATAPGAVPDGAVWPLAPRPHVVRGFKPPPHPWESGHRGVDLAGQPGQEVRSALAGTVTFAGTLAGRGVVVVDHGDRRTTYEPVQAVGQVGDVVTAGAVIGRLQGGPGHCPPQTCLHWGLLVEDDYRDPLSLVGTGPVRLLPLLPALLRPAGEPGGTRSSAARW